jgi:hypothetical protein
MRSVTAIKSNNIEYFAWVGKAVAGEERKPTEPLWENAPSAESMFEERLRRINFLRKFVKKGPRAATIADQLEACEPGNRCASGTCPECGRLFQRWFVRKSRKFMERYLNKPSTDLIAITIIPTDPIIRPGKLNELSIENSRRRPKYAMKKANIGTAIGGIDFSFNEDKTSRYEPFWSVHYYVVLATENRERLKGLLQCSFRPSISTPRPIKITSFQNSARRRSYILKMKFDRRIGYDQLKQNGNEFRTCRNTSRDKLRAAERLELLLYLDRIGLAKRVIFRNCKPINSKKGISIKSASCDRK